MFILLGDLLDDAAPVGGEVDVGRVGGGAGVLVEVLVLHHRREIPGRGRGRRPRLPRPLTLIVGDQTTPTGDAAEGVQLVGGEALLVVAGAELGEGGAGRVADGEEVPEAGVVNGQLDRVRLLAHVIVVDVVVRDVVLDVLHDEDDLPVRLNGVVRI